MLPFGLLDLIAAHMPSKRQVDAPTAADFYVKSLPGLSAQSRLQLYAGHLPAYNAETAVDGGADPHLFLCAFLLALLEVLPDWIVCLPRHFTRQTGVAF
jgi:hypothetical protein